MAWRRLRGAVGQWGVGCDLLPLKKLTKFGEARARVWLFCVLPAVARGNYTVSPPRLLRHAVVWSVSRWNAVFRGRGTRAK